MITKGTSQKRKKPDRSPVSLSAGTLPQVLRQTESLLQRRGSNRRGSTSRIETDHAGFIGEERALSGLADGNRGSRRGVGHVARARRRHDERVTALGSRAQNAVNQASCS